MSIFSSYANIKVYGVVSATINGIVVAQVERTSAFTMQTLFLTRSSGESVAFGVLGKAVIHIPHSVQADHAALWASLAGPLSSLSLTLQSPIDNGAKYNYTCDVLLSAVAEPRRSELLKSRIVTECATERVDHVRTQTRIAIEALYAPAIASDAPAWAALFAPAVPPGS